MSTTDPGFYRWTQWIFLQLYGAWFDERVQRARASSRDMVETTGTVIGPPRARAVSTAGFTPVAQRRMPLSDVAPARTA